MGCFESFFSDNFFRSMSIYILNPSCHWGIKSNVWFLQIFSTAYDITSTVLKAFWFFTTGRLKHALVLSLYSLTESVLFFLQWSIWCKNLYFTLFNSLRTPWRLNWISLRPSKQVGLLHVTCPDYRNSE